MGASTLCKTLINNRVLEAFANWHGLIACMMEMGCPFCFGLRIVTVLMLGKHSLSDERTLGHKLPISPGA